MTRVPNMPSVFSELFSPVSFPRPAQGFVDLLLMSLEHGPFLVEEQFVQLRSDMRSTILKAKYLAKVGDNILKLLLPSRITQFELTRIQFFGVSELGIDNGLRTSAEWCLSTSRHDYSRIGWS